MPGIICVSFPPPTPRSRFLLSAPVLLHATRYLTGVRTMLTDGSRPTYHRHPHVQNPASGVNVPEFPGFSLLNMHLLRAGGREWGDRGWIGWDERRNGILSIFPDARDWNAG